MKYTLQREIILKTLFENSTHFTPESLHRFIRDSYPNLNIGVATIYRTLGLLEKSDIISSISFGIQGKKYEFEQTHHDHLICDECGDIVEFLDKDIEKKQLEIAKEFGYKIVSHMMQIHGICPKCQAKLNEKE
ncbi:MAG: transcriptional repressor [Campylobacterales bacterium]|nr:transcriptional repressor [Campylobacterales bacterium]